MNKSTTGYTASKAPGLFFYGVIKEICDLFAVCF